MSDLNEKCQEILGMLENAYTGARMLDDVDCMIRIARAIEAFNLSTEVNVVIREDN